MFRRLFAASVALAVLLPAASASAGQAPSRGDGLTAGTTSPGQTFEQAFSLFGDRRLYTAVPNGSFEDGSAGWQISGDATVVAHANPFRPEPGASALRMGPGSVAISPPVCVAKGYPSARGFLKRLNGRVRSALGVEVLYPARRTGKAAFAKPAGSLGGSALFGPTRRFSIAQGLAGGGPVEVRFRLTVRGSGTFLVDDLLVDPRCRS